MASTHKAILKYTLLPGLWPRIKALFATGFSYTAYLIAIIYQAVRLLPPTHPYLNPANIGRYGIRHVIVEAGQNLKFKKKNIDQIIIYFTILGGIGVLFAQIILLVLALVAQQPSLAGATEVITLPGKDFLSATSIYQPATFTTQDMAFVLLDRIFGLKNIFNSCISTAATCTDIRGNPLPNYGTYPSPFHLALHNMLHFYSLGMFFVGAIIITYFITTITAETAVTGSPFGQRVNKAWAPIRLVMFFALLVPLNIGNTNEGLNGAQIGTFWVAKLGSNFATNAWGRFNEVLTTGTYLGPQENLVGIPNTPDLAQLNEMIRFIFVARTCKIAEEAVYVHSPTGVQAYVVSAGKTPIDFRTSNYKSALKYSDNGAINIVFGVPDTTKKGGYRGDINPVCGSMKMPLSAMKSGSGINAGAELMQDLYYTIINIIWDDQTLIEHADCIYRSLPQREHFPGCTPDKSIAFADKKIKEWRAIIDNAVPAAVKLQTDNGDWLIPPGLEAKGWAGAAIWYNRVAELNGSMMASVLNIPQPVKYPRAMEDVAEQHRQESETLNPELIFKPVLKEGEEVDYSLNSDQTISIALYNAYRFWQTTEFESNQFTSKGPGPFIQAINFVFGTSGLFDMRKNADTHPLAQLSMVGKGIMEAAVRNILGGYAGSIMSSAMPDILKSLGEAGSGFFKTIGTATLGIGFVLYYVLPFMPFIYFFFAVSGWIRSIFEAIVAMPLWALAHICHMDGDGLPGPAAGNGYYLLLEIFLRPILILFGMLASITIFSALVIVLNDIFTIVVANISGFDFEEESKNATSWMEFMRGPIDEFFFTAMYTIICYMMGTSAFKMIDTVPNNILRWIGNTVSTFQESANDPADQVMQQMYRGGTLMANMTSLKGGQVAALMS